MESLAQAMTQQFDSISDMLGVNLKKGGQMPKNPRSKWEVHVSHNYTESHDKLYVVRVDMVGGDKPYRVVAAWGARERNTAQAEKGYGDFADIQSARRQADVLRTKKEREGYVNVESAQYQRTTSVKDVLDRKWIDISRIFGYADPSPSQPRDEEPAPVVRRKETVPGASRAHREIE